MLGPITYSEHPKSCSEFDEKPNDRLSRCWPKYTLPSQSAVQFSHFVIQEKNTTRIKWKQEVEIELPIFYICKYHFDITYQVDKQAQKIIPSILHFE